MSKSVDRGIGRSGMTALLVSVALGFLLLASAPSVLAHAGVTGTNPLDGEMLTTAPQQVEVEFSERLINAGAALVVTGPDGSVVSEAKPAIKGRAMIARINGAPGPGEYSVAYRVVSEDGHAVKGRFTFFVEGGAPEPQAIQSQATPSQTGQSQIPQPQTTQPQATDQVSTETTATESDSAGSPWFLIAIGAVVVVAIVVGIAFVRRRST